MSLYRPNSALSRLNRDGALDDPPIDLVRVLSESRAYSELSGGAFDVTVQPLWELYAGHFFRPGASPDGPSAEAIAAAVTRVGRKRSKLTLRACASPNPAWGLRSTGSDRVTSPIESSSCCAPAESSMRSLTWGKPARSAGHPVGGPWSVRLEDPRAPGTIAERIPLVDRAIATAGVRHLVRRSRPLQSYFRTVERSHQLALAIGLGRGGHSYQSNALSNAFAVMPEEATAPIVRARRLVAHFVRPDGSRFAQRA